MYELPSDTKISEDLIKDLRQSDRAPLRFTYACVLDLCNYAKPVMYLRTSGLFLTLTVTYVHDVFLRRKCIPSKWNFDKKYTMEIFM